MHFRHFSEVSHTRPLGKSLEAKCEKPPNAFMYLFLCLSDFNDIWYLDSYRWELSRDFFPTSESEFAGRKMLTICPAIFEKWRV